MVVAAVIRPVIMILVLRGAPDLTPVPQARGLRAFLDFVKAAAQDNRDQLLIFNASQDLT